MEGSDLPVDAHAPKERSPAPPIIVRRVSANMLLHDTAVCIFTPKIGDPHRSHKKAKCEHRVHTSA
jgi:hypothetical protein